MTAKLPVPPPPQGVEDILDCLRLIRSPRVGPATYLRLLEEHGSAPAALAALPEIAAKAGVKNYAPCPAQRAVREYESGLKIGARLICIGMADYPEPLTHIGDPPPLLWAHGQIGVLARPTVALVGARNASSLGIRMARALASGLGGASLVVASGLARGIDTAAHNGALASGTIAVLAGGLARIYPPENQGLAREIAENGLLLSEQPPQQAAQARLFPRRNRIIAGLSRAVVVVEAAAKSGSMITARDALDQGREVMAVPGHPMDARAAGCNMLIRDGATLIRNAADILEVIGRPEPTTKQPPLSIPPATYPRTTRTAEPPPRASISEALDLGRRILSRLGTTPIAEDQLIRDLDASARSVAPHLVELELAGKVERQSGGLLARVPHAP